VSAATVVEFLEARCTKFLAGDTNSGKGWDVAWHRQQSR
jgi:hypothetical protein